MREGIEFLHRQRIHVGAQAHSAPAGTAVAPVHDAHHAGLAHAAMKGNAPLRELCGHEVGGAHFLETQLGVGVDVAAQRGDGGRLGGDGVNGLHGSFPSIGTV